MDNIILAVFNGDTFARTVPLWQYDRGIQLKFVDIVLPTTYEVHFSHTEDGEALTVIGDSNGVQIPDELLENDSTVFAWVYVVGETYGKTKYKVKIPVRSKAEATGTTPTPTQQTPLDDAINRLNQASQNLENATEAIPQEINNTLAAAKESGEFDGPPGEDGADGTMLWYTNERIISASATGHDGAVLRRRLTGRDGVTPAVGDYVYGPAVGESGTPTTIYIIAVSAVSAQMDILCSIVGPQGEQGEQGPAGSDGQPGQDGVSQEVTITEIQGGHRITITDADHPNGQSFDVLDGQDAVIAAKYTKPGSGIPKTDLATDVQTSLGKANTALQQHQDISGKADKVTEITISAGGDVTQALDAGKIYHFTGTLSSLTLTLNAPASGQLAQYHFDFESGSTAPTFTPITGITWPDGAFEPEASAHYECDILNGYALYIGWEVTT